MSNKIRVAILGYGHLGKWHCQKVIAHSQVAELKAIIEKFPAAATSAKEAYPNIKIANDIKEVINEIDAAFIVTPTSTHFELVKYLLENKKHVFCEKPVCSNDFEANQLSKINFSKEIVFQVGHSERFHAAWEMLSQQFKNLKPPYTVRINRVAAFKGRATDVDVVQDLAIHDLDLLVFLFKQKPLKIKANAYKVRTQKWDHANIKVSMEQGCEAHIVVSRNHVKEIRDLEVISEDGMIFVDLFQTKYFQAPKVTKPEEPFVVENTYEKRDHLMIEHKLFYGSIQTARAAIVGVKEGMRAVHLVDCTLESIKNNTEVEVKLHE